MDSNMLELDRNALKEADLAEALTMTGCRDLADLIDMANVGRSMMERMAQVTESGPMRGWSPADDPAEIVTDLANKLDDALHDYGNAESEAKGAEVDIAGLTARAEAAEQRERRLREAASDLIGAFEPWSGKTAKQEDAIGRTRAALSEEEA